MTNACSILVWLAIFPLGNQSDSGKQNRKGKCDADIMIDYPFVLYPFHFLSLIFSNQAE
jgi:hypothetical protein